MVYILLKIENSDQLLTDVVYQKAHKLYGPNLDPLIKERIERELNSVINNGYGVIYYVSHLLVKKSNEDGYLVGSKVLVSVLLLLRLWQVLLKLILCLCIIAVHIVIIWSGITRLTVVMIFWIKCPKCQKKQFNW